MISCYICEDFILLTFIYQNATQPLKDCTDLRDDVHIALAEFKETCGLSSIANVKQCIRLLATRVSNAAEQSSLTVTLNEEVIEIKSWFFYWNIIH